MATFITDLASPAELTGFVREEATGGLPFAEFFPTQEVPDIMYELENVDLAGTNEVARYRSWDTVPPIGRRPGISIIGGEIPPLGWAYRLNEQDIGRMGRIRAGVGEASDQRVVDVLFNDARRATNAVQNRVTIAHADVLTTGTFKLTELGNVDPATGLAATFNVPATQLNVVPGVLWSDRTNSLPADNLLAWEEIYAANNGDAPPDAWFITKAVANDLIFNAQLRSQFPFSTGTGVGVPARIDQAAVQSVFTAMGVQAPIRVIDVRRPALTGGARAKMIPDRFVIGAKAGMGKTLYGIAPIVSMLAADPQTRIEASDAPGIVAYAMESFGATQAPQVTTRAEGVVAPVLTDPNGLFVAQV